MTSPPRAERSLPQGEVHLWYAALASAAGCALAEAALGWMNDEERARHDRYRFERNRLEYRVTRGLIRSLLGAYLGVSPGGLRFGATPHGKPFLEAPASDLRFNLSNTEGMVVCLVGRSIELGVDVEPLARRVDVRGMAHRFFAPSEVEALMALPEGRHQRRFLAYWTLKEAYIKACGQGLGIPLDHFAYELDEQDRILGLRFAAEREDDPASWQLMQLELGPEHLVGVALRRGNGPDQRLVVREAELTRS
ncbi:MAG: 4'-phosphopantetheinyl transferase superfamily protein [Polyangiaceae bacterium]|jgi:4'-phosphopantetheinyl transferase|nr:4'-phosphopantetheinyl transferase superfamily protein [Polyangiaceae bacterium]